MGIFRRFDNRLTTPISPAVGKSANADPSGRRRIYLMSRHVQSSTKESPTGSASQAWILKTTQGPVVTLCRQHVSMIYASKAKMSSSASFATKTSASAPTAAINQSVDDSLVHCKTMRQPRARSRPTEIGDTSRRGPSHFSQLPSQSRREIVTPLRERTTICSQSKPIDSMSLASLPESCSCCSSV